MEYSEVNSVIGDIELYSSTDYQNPLADLESMTPTFNNFTLLEPALTLGGHANVTRATCVGTVTQIIYWDAITIGAGSKEYFSSYNYITTHDAQVIYALVKNNAGTPDTNNALLLLLQSDNTVDAVLVVGGVLKAHKTEITTFTDDDWFQLTICWENDVGFTIYKGTTIISTFGDFALPNGDYSQGYTCFSVNPRVFSFDRIYQGNDLDIAYRVGKPYIDVNNGDSERNPFSNEAIYFMKSLRTLHSSTPIFPYNDLIENGQITYFTTSQEALDYYKGKVLTKIRAHYNETYDWNVGRANKMIKDGVLWRQSEILNEVKIDVI